jgi:hypothetical protein
MTMDKDEFSVLGHGEAGEADEATGPGPRRREPGPRGARVRLPGFVAGDEEVGLGDVVKRMTSAAGIPPCGGCGRRAAALNRWVAFSGRHGRG